MSELDYKIHSLTDEILKVCADESFDIITMSIAGVLIHCFDQMTEDTRKLNGEFLMKVIEAEKNRNNKLQA